jgi:hypothetical protein
MCNTHYMGDLGRRTMVPGQPSEKLRLYLKNNLKQRGLGDRGIA